MYRRILVALDGSPPAARVLPWLRRVCGGAATTIYLVTVTPPREGADVPGVAVAYPHQLEEQDRDIALASLQGTAAALRHDGHHVMVEVRTGADRAGTVLAVAREARVELVALTTRGVRGPRALWTRSLAADLLRRSPVPVLVARRTGQRAA
jgi:nucleotide-binding universal stress UspA family protein